MNNDTKWLWKLVEVWDKYERGKRVESTRRYVQMQKLRKSTEYESKIKSTNDGQ